MTKITVDVNEIFPKGYDQDEIAMNSYHMYHSCQGDKNFFNAEHNRCPRCIVIAEHIAREAVRLGLVKFKGNILEE